MAAPSEEFHFAYDLVKSGGVYTVVDSSPGQSGVQPAALDVDLVDPQNDGARPGKLTIDSIASGSLSSTGGKYTFVGTADLGGHSGFIIKDSAGNFYYLTNTAYAGNLNNKHGQLNNVVTDTNPLLCFMEGTHIATPDGEVSVETLAIGDIVRTVDGKAAPIRWIGVQTVSKLFADPVHSYPIRIRANAIADHVPSRDLLLSPGHAVAIDGALFNAGALINGSSIVREYDLPSKFTYYHIELADHLLILAENTPSETFIDNIDRSAFDNWEEHRELFGDSVEMMEMSYPRAKSQRQVPVSLRVKLATRGDELYGDVAAANVA